VSLLKCSGCGWIHMGRSRDEVDAEIESFNVFFSTIDQDTKDAFGGRESRIEDYMKCFKCGADYTGMLPADPTGGDDRCFTIQSILDPLWA